MKTVCVYLGANSGNNNQFSEAVVLLAKELADMAKDKNLTQSVRGYIRKITNN